MVDLEEWKPKTKLGRLVKEGKITNIDDILDGKWKIREPEIVDYLLPNLEVEFMKWRIIRGKFRSKRLYRIAQKKTAEGAKARFEVIAIVGDKDGHVGVGLGRSAELAVAREKAIRNAKLNIIKVARGCGSWECACGTPHSIPFQVEGKSGSVRVILKPAPKGVGLVAENEIKKIFRLAGIKDIWMKSFGKTKTKMNHVFAVYDALKKTAQMRVPHKFFSLSGLAYGSLVNK